MAHLSCINVAHNQNVRTPESEAHVVENVHENPKTLVWQISHAKGTTLFTVHRVLKAQGLNPFHYIRVQSLMSDNHCHRVKFCKWILEHNKEPNFVAFVL